MRIAIVCYPTHGGSGVIASELALGLAERGHQIHIVSYAVPFRLRGFHPRVAIHEVEVSTYYLESLLSCADLFLLPSEQESFGLAALEAMSCEVPVVGTEVGGLPEVVAHGHTGYLLPVGGIQAMAEAAIELLTDADRLQSFARRGRARAVEEFDAASIIPRYERFYERLLETRSE